MFKASNVLPAFATALLCTVWMILAPMAGIPGWSGFAGCTAYFAAQRHQEPACDLCLRIKRNCLRLALAQSGSAYRRSGIRPLHDLRHHVSHVLCRRKQTALLCARRVHGLVFHLCSRRRHVCRRRDTARSAARPCVRYLGKGVGQRQRKQKLSESVLERGQSIAAAPATHPLLVRHSSKNQNLEKEGLAHAGPSWQ